MSELRDLVAECWPKAQAHWSRFLLLKHPIDRADQPSVAQIDLASRQVMFHGRKIAERNLHDCMEAILAHEIGHHVRYPATLAVQARLRLIEQSILPFKEYSVINLFTDLLINDALAGVLQEQLIKVYQAFHVDQNWEVDPAYVFYMAVYEELWQREPGELMGPGQRPFEAAFPDYRADAQLLAQNLFHLGPNLFTQYLYFVSIVCRYIEPRRGKEPVSGDPYSCKCGEPSDEDWADALTPTPREQEAIRRALAEGWFDRQQSKTLDECGTLERRIHGLPGANSGPVSKVPDVMAAYYRQQAERYLVKPPPQRRVGEAVVPTTLEEWEPGDAVRDIDWLITLSQRGDVLGAVQPMRRTRIAENEGFDVPLWQPRVEIYLDVSGSMPDPRYHRNAMTLAAQILLTAAIRAGGWARALLYSAAPVAHWEWCRSEIELSKFLMHYIGGGTVFPFDVLSKSAVECRGDQPIRVVITDTDFDVNYEQKPEHAVVFTDAVRESPHFILLLHRPNMEKAARYAKAGAKVIPVAQMDDYPQMAGDLSRALFDQERRHE